jgi:copper chaperone NosL
MAISQAAYAAEFVDKDGSVLKFDDIGCMVRYVREHDRKDAVAAFFVMDYNDKHWLAAQQATYVKSDRSPSPMASGLTAFREPAQAHDYAEKNKGQTLGFDDLWKGDVAEPPRHSTMPR